jgi:penicillin-binding protein 1C
VLRRLAALLALVFALPFTMLGVYAAFVPVLPLDEAAGEGGAPVGEATRADSLRVTDRNGVLLRDVRTGDGKRARRLTLQAFGERVPRAVIAAEDKRFYSHAGVDALALARAAWDSAREGRVASGASTLTQQLARTLVHAPRTTKAKLEVMALALRLEAAYSKEQILEAYLNEIEFGPNVRGAEAAAELYFGKPCSELSLAEAAAIASIPRGPTIYDPTRRPEQLRKRRDRVLDRIEDAGLATREEVARAKGEPIVLAPRFSPSAAPHLVAALLAGRLGPVPAPEGGELRTSIVAELQTEATVAARRTIDALGEQGVTAASVVVLDNISGEILAYVGSPDATDVARLGGNDGVLALRQPGSALKPFVYELGMERLGLLPSSMLPDIELSFPGPDGASFRPRNYDGTFHGPVLLRDALGSSFNIPAVHVAERLGSAAVLERLRALGFASLDREAEHYGLALALGDGEVRLLDLANAYATLARGGLARPVVATAGGGASGEAERVLDERAAYLVTHVLTDPSARLASFGDDSVLELPFEVAAKTGTSKGYRDNVTVGYTPEVTVAVWVGNFDGSPMRGVSGITGAGPLFHEVMRAAARLRPPTPFARPEGLADVEVCALSGHRPGADCPHRRMDVVPEGTELATCEMHRRARVDRLTGERAGASCSPRFVEERVFEVLPPIYADWARAARRPLLPATFSDRCPAGPEDDGPTSHAVRIVYPREGARFFVEPSGRRPTIRVRVASSGEASLRLDGRPVPDAVLVLGPGTHTITATAGGERDEVTVTVE